MTMVEKNNPSSNNNDKRKKQDGNNQHHNLVHSQVKKIKQESAKDGVEWPPWQPEMTVVRETFTRQHSRSRLGQPITVGDS